MMLFARPVLPRCDTDWTSSQCKSLRHAMPRWEHSCNCNQWCSTHAMIGLDQMERGTMSLDHISRMQT